MADWTNEPPAPYLKTLLRPCAFQQISNLIHQTFSCESSRGQFQPLQSSFSHYGPVFGPLQGQFYPLQASFWATIGPISHAMGSSSHYKPVLTPTGQFSHQLWFILYHSRPDKPQCASFSHYRPVLATKGQFQPLYGQFWPLQASFRHYRSVLATIGQFQPLQASFSHYRPVLAPIGQFQPLQASFSQEVEEKALYIDFRYFTVDGKKKKKKKKSTLFNSDQDSRVSKCQ